MRIIEDFVTKHRARLSSPVKGAVVKLATFCDTTPEEHLALLEHELGQMQGQIYDDFQKVKAGIEKHLGI